MERLGGCVDVLVRVCGSSRSKAEDMSASIRTALLQSLPSGSCPGQHRMSGTPYSAAYAAMVASPSPPHLHAVQVHHAGAERHLEQLVHVGVSRHSVRCRRSRAAARQPGPRRKCATSGCGTGSSRPGDACAALPSPGASHSCTGTQAQRAPCHPPTATISVRMAFTHAGSCSSSILSSRSDTSCCPAEPFSPAARGPQKPAGHVRAGAVRQGQSGKALRSQAEACPHVRASLEASRG
jgi:hypothetical protein